MKVLVTAGSTMTPIDKVRAVTNIFGGRTGQAIANCFASQRASVTLLTSDRNYKVKDVNSVRIFRTFDQLNKLMEEEIKGGDYDVIIHSAAVSDYQSGGMFFKDESRELQEIDSSTKISSNHEEMFLRLVPTAKLVDKIRPEWGFKGKLVKFKLQVGISDEELIEIAKASRKHSKADMIVANCLEWAGHYAYIIDNTDKAKKVPRKDLAEALYWRLAK